MKELIRLDALFSMHDMGMRVRPPPPPPPSGQHSGGRNIYIDPLFSENASKNDAFFF